jgi:hypothetical protein
LAFCGQANAVNLKFAEEQLQILRLGLPQNARQTSVVGHFDVSVPSGAKQVAEKVPSSHQFHPKRASGAKARVILLALSARLKSCPDSCLDSAEFFRKLQNPATFAPMMYGQNPVPFKLTHYPNFAQDDRSFYIVDFRDRTLMRG